MYRQIIENFKKLYRKVNRWISPKKRAARTSGRVRELAQDRSGGGRRRRHVERAAGDHALPAAADAGDAGGSGGGSGGHGDGSGRRRRRRRLLVAHGTRRRHRLGVQVG